MSGILRNTLRLVGTAKYAPSNSTKYLQCMTLTTNRLNNLLGFQANQISTNFWTTIQTAGQKILSIFEEEIRMSNIDNYSILLNNGKVGLMTLKKEKNLIFPSTFNIEFNGKSIEPKSNKVDDEVGKAVSFWIDKWNVSLDGDELQLKTKDTDETFILKHALHVKLHKTPSKLLEDGGLKSSPTALFSDEIIMYPAKVISKPEGSEPLVKSYEPVEMERQTYANKGSIYELTDKPNEFGRMKLKFPMTASLEGAQQEIHSENMEDTFTVSYTANIQANKNELPKNLTNGIRKAKKRKTSTIGRLRMQLQSGDLLLKTSSKHRVFIRHEVVIEIDLDSEVPSILINPAIKRHMCEDDLVE